MRTRDLIAIVVLTLGLVSCATEGAGDNDAGGDETATSSPTPTPTPEPQTETSPEQPADDQLGALRAMDHVTTVTETEPGRLEVETDLIDPRGDNGSVEAQAAIEICEAAVAALEDGGVGEPFVAVLEEDGTSWILHGHPSYPDPCAEV